MPRVTNRQSRSVGNLGDILKHAALVELASLLADTRSTVCWVDTHTFLLHAPPADLERWRREIDEMSARPAYARYARLERACLEQTSRYRCSSGLVLDVLGHRRGAAVLGEANGATREELREQLRAEQLANVRVTDDAAAALEVALEAADTADATLVHVDPFSLSPELWASLSARLDALVARSSDFVLVAYRYTRMAPSSWPAAPSGTTGPVGETRGGPHELAVYASPRLADPVRTVCAGLGWRLG